MLFFRRVDGLVSFRFLSANLLQPSVLDACLQAPVLNLLVSLFVHLRCYRVPLANLPHLNPLPQGERIQKKTTFYTTSDITSASDRVVTSTVRCFWRASFTIFSNFDESYPQSNPYRTVSIQLQAHPLQPQHQILNPL